MVETILVTGGSGFIGNNLIRLILDKYSDLRIINLDKLTYAGNPDNLKDLEKDPNYTFIKGYISDPAIVRAAMKKADHVVHFAAEDQKFRNQIMLLQDCTYTIIMCMISLSRETFGQRELEITDVKNAYIKQGNMSFSIFKGYWSDAGTFESLYRASHLVRNKNTPK